jgi:DNA-directed RNA polymerase specialized sigma subunit
MGVRIYDEAGFDRKLRREAGAPLWDDAIASRDVAVRDLVQEQLIDLVEGLPLPRRSRDVMRLKIDGWTLREIASILGISRQRVERIWAGLLDRLPNSLTAMEEEMVPGQVPHYGWQEIYLNSVGR